MTNCIESWAEALEKKNEILNLNIDAIGMLGGSIDLKPKHKEGTSFIVKTPNREL